MNKGATRPERDLVGDPQPPERRGSFVDVEQAVTAAAALPREAWRR